MLVLFAPGAPREAYFEELAEIVASGRQLEHTARFCRRVTPLHALAVTG
ncbi:hypothetical protein ACQPYK_21440 [Streptosporangium sp. CA-135522]